jgi:hypothetical protein
MIKMNISVEQGILDKFDLDLTPELKYSCSIIAEEIRGNIKKGLDANGNALKPNAPSTMAAKVGRTTTRYKTSAKAKYGKGESGELIVIRDPHKKGDVRKMGYSKPLIDIHKKLIATEGVYIVSSPGRNHAVLNLTNSIHPDSRLSVSDIGTINNFGNGKIPARPFFGITKYAFNRIVAFIADEIDRICNGRPRLLQNG